MIKAGKSQQEIAQALGLSQSTVSKEMARNRGQRDYRAKQAQRKASERQAAKKKGNRVITGELEAQVRKRLEMKHSPEQISLRLKAEGIEVSHESIYQYIKQDKRQGGELYKNLRINGKRRYRRHIKAGRRTKIPRRVDIQERPEVVNTRARYGDWEADLIEGTQGSGYILSLYERKSRFGKWVPLSTRSSEATTRALIEQLEGYNVENYNSLVRQYLPKGTSFTDLTVERLKQIEEEINLRPRKILDIKSPSELEIKLAA